MDCPVCRTAMLVLELDEVEIDHCPQCRGVWLDGGELELLLEGVQDKERLLNSFQQETSSKEKKYRCPICHKGMIKVLYGHAQTKILLDKCKKNDGLWFDGGELEKVLELESSGRENKVVHLLKDIFGRKISI